VRRSAKTLHGPGRTRCAVALLLIDVINDLEFPGGEKLARHALPMAQALLALKRRAAGLGIPTIYVNDNFGRWRSDFRKLVTHCLEDGVRGEAMVRLLEPDERDYFVLKPRHSAFFGTTLDVLLESMGVRRLILTGVAGDICVYFSAGDAHLRGYDLVVPSDCVTSEDPRENAHALRRMRSILDVRTPRSRSLRLEPLMKKTGTRPG
jgi:nicotinamidase-related amidase